MSDRPNSQVPSVERSEADSHGACDLRRVRDRIPAMVWLVAAVGFWERAAFWGLTGPWQNYMENSRNYTMEQTPGALDLGQSTATRIYCGFFVLYYTCPIFFAPLIDSRLGQYKTLVVSLVIYNLGCIALVVSSAPKLLENGSGLPGLAVAMLLIALGGGCSQATIRSFIAAQYTDRTPRVQKRLASQNQFWVNLGKRLEHTRFAQWFPVAAAEEVVLVDPELTLKFVYTLLFWVGNVGALLVFPIVCIERFHGFFPAYLLGSGCVFIALLMVIAGKRFFVIPPLSQSVTLPAAKVLICAARSGFKMERADPHYRSVHQKKAVTWSSQFVSEITRALGACRVLLVFVVYYMCYDQMQNNLMSQAGQMNKGKLPNEVVPSMNQIGCITLSPLVQYIIDPALSKRRIYLRPVTRITIGFIFTSLAMAYAALVQYFIYISPPCYNNPSHCESTLETAIHRPNIWIQAPIFVLMAASEVFAMTTAMEYAESHAPNDMKVFVQAINMLITGLGSLCAMFIAEASHDPHLVIFYSCLAGGMAATTIIFYVIFRNKDKDERKLPQDLENAKGCDSRNKQVTPATGYTTQESLGLDVGVDSRPMSSERENPS